MAVDEQYLDKILALDCVHLEGIHQQVTQEMYSEYNVSQEDQEEIDADLKASLGVFPKRMKQLLSGELGTRTPNPAITALRKYRKGFFEHKLDKIEEICPNMEDYNVNASNRATAYATRRLGGLKALEQLMNTIDQRSGKVETIGKLKNPDYLLGKIYAEIIRADIASLRDNYNQHY